MQLYLNNSGHRWINVDDKGNRDRVAVRNPQTGEVRRRAVKFWEAIGNFAVPSVVIKNKLEILMESGRTEGEWVVNNEENRAWKYQNKIKI